MNRQAVGGMGCALAAGLLWGCSGTISQFLFTTRAVDSAWLTTVRLLAAGALLTAAAAVRTPQRLRALLSERSSVLRLALFGILGLMSCQLTYTTAIAHSNSATATALQYLGQALILLVTCVRLRRAPSGKEALALLLALGGVFLLATHGRPGTLVLTPAALGWGLGAAVSLMLYTLLPGRLIAVYGSIPVAGCGMVLGGLVLGLATGFWNRTPALDPVMVLGVAVIVLLGTAAAFSLYLQAVHLVGGVRASLLACAEPVCAALTTALFLKTPLAAADWLAFGMILLMAILLALPARERRSSHGSILL